MKEKDKLTKEFSAHIDEAFRRCEESMKFCTRHLDNSTPHGRAAFVGTLVRYLDLWNDLTNGEIPELNRAVNKLDQFIKDYAKVEERTDGLHPISQIEEPVPDYILNDIIAAIKQLGARFSIDLDEADDNAGGKQ